MAPREAAQSFGNKIIETWHGEGPVDPTEDVAYTPIKDICKATVDKRPEDLDPIDVDYNSYLASLTTPLAFNRAIHEVGIVLNSTFKVVDEERKLHNTLKHAHHHGKNFEYHVIPRASPVTTPKPSDQSLAEKPDQSSDKRLPSQLADPTSDQGPPLEPADQSPAKLPAPEGFVDSPGTEPTQQTPDQSPEKKAVPSENLKYRISDKNVRFRLCQLEPDTSIILQEPIPLKDFIDPASGVIFEDAPINRLDLNYFRTTTWPDRQPSSKIIWDGAKQKLSYNSDNGEIVSRVIINNNPEFREAVQRMMAQSSFSTPMYLDFWPVGDDNEAVIKATPIPPTPLDITIQVNEAVVILREQVDDDDLYTINLFSVTLRLPDFINPEDRWDASTSSISDAVNIQSLSLEYLRDHVWPSRKKEYRVGWEEISKTLTYKRPLDGLMKSVRTSFEFQAAISTMKKYQDETQKPPNQRSRYSFVFFHPGSGMLKHERMREIAVYDADGERIGREIYFWELTDEQHRNDKFINLDTLDYDKLLTIVRGWMPDWATSKYVLMYEHEEKNGVAKNRSILSSSGLHGAMRKLIELRQNWRASLPLLLISSSQKRKRSIDDDADNDDDASSKRVKTDPIPKGIADGSTGSDVGSIDEEGLDLNAGRKWDPKQVIATSKIGHIVDRSKEEKDTGDDPSSGDDDSSSGDDDPSDKGSDSPDDSGDSDAESDSARLDKFLRDRKAIAHMNTEEWKAMCNMVGWSEKRISANHRIPILGFNAALYPYQALCVYHLMRRNRQIGGNLLADEMGYGKTRSALAVVGLERWLSLRWADIAQSREAGDNRHLPEYSEQQIFSEDEKKQKCTVPYVSDEWGISCPCTPGNATYRWFPQVGINIAIVPTMNVWYEEWINLFGHTPSEPLNMQLSVAHGTEIPEAPRLGENTPENTKLVEMNKRENEDDGTYYVDPNANRHMILTTRRSYNTKVEKMLGLDNFVVGIAFHDECHQEHNMTAGIPKVLRQMTNWQEEGGWNRAFTIPITATPLGREGSEILAIVAPWELPEWSEDRVLRILTHQHLRRVVEAIEKLVRLGRTKSPEVTNLRTRVQAWFKEGPQLMMIQRTRSTMWFDGRGLLNLPPHEYRDVPVRFPPQYREDLKALTARDVQALKADQKRRIRKYKYENVTNTVPKSMQVSKIGAYNSAVYRSRLAATIPVLAQLCGKDPDLRLTHEELQENNWATLKEPIVSTRSTKGKKKSKDKPNPYLTVRRQIGRSPKLIALDNIIAELGRDFRNRREKLVVMSSAPTIAILVHMALCDKGHSARLMTSKLPGTERAKIVREFNEDEQFQILVGTTGVMGQGISLVRAFRIVLMEPSSMARVEDQAIFRINRIGQMNRLTISYRLYCEDSIPERRLMDKHDIRSELLGQALDAKASASTKQQRDPSDESEEDDEGEEV